jgi:peptide/nickel transport system substrate-binding protein
MASSRRRLAAAATVAVASLALAACTGNGSSAGGSRTTPATAPVPGGTLNMLGAGDIDYMDPNLSYYSIGYLNLRMWTRQLFAYPAQTGKTTTPVPDLATEIPTAKNGGISADGKTYTVKIRPGRSPPPISSEA